MEQPCGAGSPAAYSLPPLPPPPHAVIYNKNNNDNNNGRAYFRDIA